MSSFRHIISQARRRELIDRTLSLGGRGLAWGIAAGIAVLLVDRVAGLAIPANTYLLLPAVGFLIGSILAQLSQPAELEVAVRLDRKLRLKDRIGTARSLEDSHHPADPEFAEFVQTQAEQLASSLDVRSATPIRVDGVWSAAGALALLLWLGVVFLPSVDWLRPSKSADVPQPDPQTLQQAQEVSRSIEQVVKDLPRDNQLDQQSIEDLQALDRLAQQLSTKPTSAEAVGEARDESAAKLDEVADRVAAQAERDLAASDEVAKRFAGMEKTRGPKPPLTAQQFEEALKRGDFGDAAQRLDELNKSHEQGKFTPAQQKAAAEQLREIAEQLERGTNPSSDELAEQREQLAQAMRDQGLDQQAVEELLDDPPSQEQIEQELRNRNVDPEVALEMSRDLDRLRDKQEVNEQADRDTRDVKESLEQAAEKLQQPPGPPQQQPPSASQPSPASNNKDQKPPPSSATQPQREQSQSPSRDQAREQQSDKQSKSSENQQDRSSEKSQSNSQQKGDSKTSDQQQEQSSTEPQQQQQSDQNQSNQQSEKTTGSGQQQQDSQQAGEPKQSEQSQSGAEKAKQQSSSPDASQDQQQQTQNGKGSQQQSSTGKDEKHQSPQQQDGKSPSPADALRRLAQRQEKAQERQQISEQMRQAARELAQKMTPQEREEWAKQWQRENPPEQEDSTQQEKSQPEDSETNQQQPGDSQQGDQNADQNAPDEKLTEKDIQSLREMARDIYDKMTPQQREQLAQQMQKAMESQQQQQQQQSPQPDQQSQPDQSQNPDDQAPHQNPQPSPQNVQKDMESLMKFAQQMYDQMTPQQREQLAEQMNKMREAQQKSDAAESSSARAPKGKPNGKGSGSRAGDQVSNPTRGRAEKLDVDRTDDVDLRGKEAGDRLIAQWLTEETPGDSPRPARSVADATQQVQQAQKVAERAVDDAAVPKGYHKLIKRYFGRLPQTVEKAAKPEATAPAATQPGG